MRTIAPSGLTDYRSPATWHSVFILPIVEHYLLYAPLCNLAAAIDRVAVQRLRDALSMGRDTGAEMLDDILATLRLGGEPAPMPRQGPLEPALLGLIPTRSCNLACEYCGFLDPDGANQVMDLSLAREAIAWYLNLVHSSGIETAEIHFFGGEPFCAEEVLDFAYHFARLRTRELGCAVRFEVVTNGTFSEERCRWAADSLDTIIVSLDGPASIQDRYRPRKDGRGSFATVARNLNILSEGSAELSIRVCVTSETVDVMPEIANWLCQSYRLVSVCFEPVQPTPQSTAAGLFPPDPWTFALRFIQAADILERHGVEPVYAAADITARQVSFCPVGHDGVIVSPDGTLSACYLVRSDWEARGFNLRLGRMEKRVPWFDDEAVEAARRLNVWNKPFCASCFCRWHCAGGCHVHHELPASPGTYDPLCIQTRLIAARNIFKSLERDDLTPLLWQHPEALARMASQPSDLLIDFEEQS